MRSAKYIITNTVTRMIAQITSLGDRFFNMSFRRWESSNAHGIAP